MKTFRIAVVSLSFLCLLTVVDSFAADALQLELSPKAIDVGTTYNGATLFVSGEVPSASHAVVRFVGELSDLHMKEKAKAFGLLWMNMGSLTFRGVPNVCIVSSEKVADDSMNVGGDGKGAVADLHLVGLKHKAQVEPARTQAASAMGELIKLKEQEGLYREITGNIICTPGTEGSKSFRAEIPIPSRLLPGKYHVQVYAVKDGRIVANGEQAIIANLVGAPAFLADLAFHNGVTYGILATIIALLSGLAIGLVFQSKGAH
jgi:hypothetical protein